MISYILFLLTICSFLFYGVVGQDKAGLLGPVFVVAYGAVAAKMLKCAWQMRVVGEGGAPAFGSRISVLRTPASGSLWILFLIYGIAMIPQAAIPFESKLVTLFVGAVIGAYLVWGSELTAFKDNRIVLGMLIFVVMICALYGLIVHFKCPERVLWVERFAVYEGRLMSTYICPNHFAHLMQMLMPFCLALLFIPQSGLYLKVLSVYSFLIFLPPMFLTESRAGWLGAITAVGVCICLMAWRRSIKLFLALVILVPLCSFLILLSGWQYSETFQKRAKPVVGFIQQQSEEGVGSEARDFRPQTWMDTIDMIKDAPLIGFGPGNYRYTFPEYRNRCKAVRVVTGHPHNEYLELIADYGLIGFGLFALSWLFGCFWILVKSLKAKEVRHAFMGFAFLGAAAGTMVHSFFDFQMHVYPNALVFALLAAIAVGPLGAKQAKSIRRKALGNREDREDGRREALGVREGARDKAALGCGGSAPLSESVGRERTQEAKEYSERRAEARERQSTVSGQKVQSPTTTAQFFFRKSFAWLLAVGYLLLASVCLQTMSSSYIRTLGDKAVEQALGIRDDEAPREESVTGNKKAEGLYRLAVKIDFQNWRAYKGMANLIYARRYHCLDMPEKMLLAEKEREWLEKAYTQNPKDPETISSLGKCLIFLGRAEGGGQRSEVRGQILEDGDQGAATSSLSMPNAQRPMPEQQIEQGLALLRQACQYRRFNDIYWWTLGGELRKAGKFEEALDVFRAMEKIKRTPSSRKNIEWLEKQISGGGDQKIETTRPLPDLRMKQGEMNLAELLDLMDE